MHAHWTKDAQNVILQAVKKTLVEITKRDFSISNESAVIPLKKEETIHSKLSKPIGKERKNDIMAKLDEENCPYFIQSDDKKVNTPINCMDCIRIHETRREMQYKEDEEEVILWSPLHFCMFNLSLMIVVMDSEPNARLNLA